MSMNCRLWDMELRNALTIELTIGCWQDIFRLVVKFVLATAHAGLFLIHLLLPVSVWGNLIVGSSSSLSLCLHHFEEKMRLLLHRFKLQLYKTFY